MPVGSFIASRLVFSKPMAGSVGMGGVPAGLAASAPACGATGWA